MKIPAICLSLLLLAGWVSDLTANEPTPHPVVAWTGKNAVAKVRLYKFTWENPRPETAIERVDFQSDNTASSPFLIAITVEP